MTCMTAAASCDPTAQRSLTWTSFNMAASIVDASLGNLAFAYDTGHNRIMQCAPDCTAPTTTTLYLNDPATGVMEEKAVSGTTTVWNDYIAAAGSLVAEHTSNSGIVSYLYFVADHLGSISAITDQTGTMISGGRQSYDAWGVRRNANGTPAASCSAITSATTRGYTQQEETLSSCLVNLNARLYDPTIGRVTSADPTVPDELDGQAYNRYSYVLNNPLNSIDPSGYDPACFQDAEISDETADCVPGPQTTIITSGGGGGFGGGPFAGGGGGAAGAADKKTNCPLSSKVNGGIFAGVTSTGQGNTGPAGTASTGIVADSSGNVAGYITVGMGGTVPGTSGSFVGFTGGGFVGGGVADFGAGFLNVSRSASVLGRAGSVDTFAGRNSRGGVVAGGAASVGAGQGITTFAGGTFTIETPSVSSDVLAAIPLLGAPFSAMAAIGCHGVN
jgi:RHS repeat-associated protein